MRRLTRASARPRRPAFGIPRLALRAGAGVFISILFAACDDGPTEPAGHDEGVVYAVHWLQENTNLVLVKLDAANGARLGKYPVKDYKRDELRAVGVNRRNGDVYLAFIRGFVRMGSEGQIYFDRDFFLHYGDNDVLVDAGAKRVWVYDGGEFNLHDAATGDLLKTIRPIGDGAVSEYDNTLVAAASPLGPTEFVKLSKDGDELWRREVFPESRTCECMAVDPKDGTIFVVSTKGVYPMPTTAYFQRLTPDGEVVLEKDITPGLPVDEVSAHDGTIWGAGGPACHINRDGEVIKKLTDKHYLVPALSRVSNTLFIAAADRGYLIRAIDTKNYRVIWSLRSHNMSGFPGWAMTP